VGIFRDIRQPGLTWRERWNYCVMPPGWSHDGSRDTSEAIKRKHLVQHPEDLNSPGFAGFEPRR
jgi:hypothetical protein